MVYHYTNFVIETNAWWLKKVRPVWWGATALGIYYVIHRFYFYGKIQANMLKETSKEDHEELARLNKRAWGYGKYYKPVYETSLKKRLYDELGANYKYAESWTTRNMNDTRTLEQVYKEEDEEYDL